MKLTAQTSLIMKFIGHPIMRSLFGAILILGGITFVKEVITKPLLNTFFTSEILIKILVGSASVFVMLLIYFGILKYIEKRKPIKINLQSAVTDAVTGTLLGGGTICVVLSILYILGMFRIVGSNDFVAFLPTAMLIFGGSLLEELVFRGILFKNIETWKGTTIAIIVSSVIFQLPHFMNSHEAFLPAVLGVLFGMVAAVLYVHKGLLWASVAFHFTWNIVQPFFGTTLSGVEEFSTYYLSEMNGPQLVTGSAFGVEDSLLSMTAALIIFLLYFKKIKTSGKWIAKP